MAKFYACPECGSTVQDDHVRLHKEWHEQFDTEPAELELQGGWPGDPDPADAGALGRL